MTQPNMTQETPPEKEPWEDQPFYEARKKVYPAAVHGIFRNIKWFILVTCLGFYYFLPFLRWDRGQNLPDQAILVDLPHRRFYFFFIELWPQEVYYFTGLLILAALALFLMNAVGGRMWCGYLCWQTVWTDLFYAVERWVEGDRRDRMKKDKAGWTFRRVWEVTLKNFLWLLIAWWTGGAWVLYFSDAPTLVKELALGQAPFVAYMWIGILTFTTFIFAGYMREQTCIYVCPWPRIQAALTDEWALNVTYRADRGEPRMSAKKAIVAREKGEPAGDCVDCNQCVAVCPTGVDIRHGSQLGCIQCGLCIDACDNVMKQIGRPTGLVAYDNGMNAERRKAGLPEMFRILRPRTLLYAGLMALVGGIMAYGLITRSNVGIAVLHQRNPLFVALSDGSVRNDYSVRFLNRLPEKRLFSLTLEGLDGAHIAADDQSEGTDGQVAFSVDSDQTRELRLHISYPRERVDGRSKDVIFRITDVKSGETSTAKDHFIVK